MDSKFIVQWDMLLELFQVGSFRADITYHEVLDWFERFKGIRILAHYHISNSKWTSIVIYNELQTYDTDFYDTREEALSAGILEAVEQLKNK